MFHLKLRHDGELVTVQLEHGLPVHHRVQLVGKGQLGRHLHPFVPEGIGEYGFGHVFVDCHGGVFAGGYVGLVVGAVILRGLKERVEAGARCVRKLYLIFISLRS